MWRDAVESLGTLFLFVFTYTFLRSILLSGILFGILPLALASRLRVVRHGFPSGKHQIVGPVRHWRSGRIDPSAIRHSALELIVVPARHTEVIREARKCGVEDAVHERIVRVCLRTLNVYAACVSRALVDHADTPAQDAEETGESVPLCLEPLWCRDENQLAEVENPPVLEGDATEGDVVTLRPGACAGAFRGAPERSGGANSRRPSSAPGRVRWA